MVFQCRAFWGGQFCRGRWCGGSSVSGKIGDGEVGFMANAGDDRNPARTDRPSNGLGVEGPEVFQAASSSAEDQGVTFKSFAGPINGRGDLGRGRVALNQCGIDYDTDLWRTTRQRCQHVP